MDDLDKLDEELFGDAGDEEDEDLEDLDSVDHSLDDLDQEDVDEDDEDTSEIGFEDDASNLDGSDEDVEGAASSEGEEDDSDHSDIDLQPTKRKSLEEADIKADSATTKYLPPALRRAQQAAAAATSTEIEDPKLRRQLMGLLNRLSPTSFPALVFKDGDSSSLNTIYLANPRAIVSKLLVSIIPEVVSAQGDGIGETQIVVLSGLVKAISSGLLGGMTVSGGTEFAATLVDHLVRQMDKTSHSKKERSNLIHFLAMLYNMQVVACTLLYDMIKEFISTGLTEDNVEALVKIVRGQRSYCNLVEEEADYLPW